MTEQYHHNFLKVFEAVKEIIQATKEVEVVAITFRSRHYPRKEDDLFGKFDGRPRNA